MQAVAGSAIGVHGREASGEGREARDVTAQEGAWSHEGWSQMAPRKLRDEAERRLMFAIHQVTRVTNDHYPSRGEGEKE